MRHDGNDVDLPKIETLEPRRLNAAQGVGERVAEWSGQVLEPVDGLAFIGRSPGEEPNVYIATGDSGMGMTHGTIAGLLLTDLIAGRVDCSFAVMASALPLVRGGQLRALGVTSAERVKQAQDETAKLLPDWPQDERDRIFGYGYPAYGYPAYGYGYPAYGYGYPAYGYAAPAVYAAVVPGKIGSTWAR